MSSIQDSNQSKGFYIWNLLGQGWKLMWQNVWQLIGYQIVLALLYLVLLGIISLIFPQEPQNPWYSNLLGIILTWLVSYSFMMGALTLALGFADKEPVQLGDFFSKISKVITFLVSSLLAGFCILVGFICLIVPGIFLAVRLSLYGYLIIDKNMGPIEALSESWKLVKGASWRVFGFMLASIVVYFAGILCLGVGLLFAYPTICIANALLYRILWKQTYLTV